MSALYRTVESVVIAVALGLAFAAIATVALGD